MKTELIDICEELEKNFDEKLERYEDRLERIGSELNQRIDTMLERHPDDGDLLEIKQLTIGLKRTHRLISGKLNIIRENSEELLGELDMEIKQRIPNMRKSIEKSETYEQAEVEIHREAHTGSDSFKDLLRALFMWRETPEERLTDKQ